MRADIETLAPLVDVVLWSRPYAEAKGYGSAEELLTGARDHASRELMTCTWGAAGAWILDARGEINHCPAFTPERVVDTIGAGDVFNAGMIASLSKGLDAVGALRFATQLAGKKVAMLGFAGL